MSLPFRRSAIVFDLDGTMIDTAADLTAALNAVLIRRGRRKVASGAIRNMIGDGAKTLVRRGLEATGGLTNDLDFEAAVFEFMSHYENNIALHSRPFPGLVETLGVLAGQGCTFGVCTNKSERFSVKLLAELGLSGHFAAVLGGDSLAVRKPDPGHLLATIAGMGALPERAVMVGDSINDIKAARAAGVPVVAVSFGYTATPPASLGADALIHRLSDLPDALTRLA
jgi:phosphoglycolate phosphatase